MNLEAHAGLEMVEALFRGERDLTVRDPSDGRPSERRFHDGEQERVVRVVLEERRRALLQMDVVTILGEHRDDKGGELTVDERSPCFEAGPSAREGAK